eukprot:evm.model.scf_6.3 EVM.evm.TU.scf_6.3   scf_6:218595-219188(-)
MRGAQCPHPFRTAAAFSAASRLWRRTHLSAGTEGNALKRSEPNTLLPLVADCQPNPRLQEPVQDDSRNVAGFAIVLALIALIVGGLAIVIAFCLLSSMRCWTSFGRQPALGNQPAPKIGRTPSTEPVYVVHPGGGLGIGERELNKGGHGDRGDCWASDLAERGKGPGPQGGAGGKSQAAEIWRDCLGSRCGINDDVR